MPLAIALGLTGFLGGSKFDSLSIFSSDKKVTTKISKATYQALQLRADEFGISISDYIACILDAEVSSHLLNQ